MYDFLIYFCTGLQTPLLFHNNISAVSNKFYNVTVQWMSSDGSADDVQYILSIYNSSNENPMNILTLLKAVNLTMQFGVNYYITVTAERCGGKLTSNTSDVLHVFYPGIIAISYFCLLFDIIT